ncbi:hypothetical protein BD560DRAFT_403308 [Blakeslea trispora]|nr:hypothetical protein BD560DRAFT_403308 [Blakeslea trispora]
MQTSLLPLFSFLSFLFLLVFLLLLSLYLAFSHVAFSFLSLFFCYISFFLFYSFTQLLLPRLLYHQTPEEEYSLGCELTATNFTFGDEFTFWLTIITMFAAY